MKNLYNYDEGILDKEEFIISDSFDYSLFVYRIEDVLC